MPFNHKKSQNESDDPVFKDRYIPMLTVLKTSC